jgi:hypothetical protein
MAQYGTNELAGRRDFIAQGGQSTDRNEGFG